MGDFNAHKWFKKQYLEEGHTEDKMRDDMEARKRSKLSPDELEKLDAMVAFRTRKTSDLKEDDLKEDILQSQFEDLYQVVRNIHHVGGYDNIEEAAFEALQRIGEEFGVNFEEGRF